MFSVINTIFKVYFRILNIYWMSSFILKCHITKLLECKKKSMKGVKRMKMFRKIMVLAIIGLFIGAVFLPNISCDEICNSGVVNHEMFFNKNNDMPSYLKSGDILFCDVKSIWLKLFKIHSNKGFSNDHCSFYIGENLFIEAVDYSLFGNILNGVQFTPMWFIRFWATNITYGTVTNISNHQKDLAFKFILDQYNEPYQYGWPGFDDYMSWHCNPDIDNQDSPYYFPEDPYLNYWFCSEIIWAGYLHQGINIDATPDCLQDFDGEYYYLVTADDIRNSENITLYQSTNMLKQLILHL